MRIINLSLKSFRNHKSLDLVFSRGCNILNGPNGAGKTNILEAVSVLSSVKSFRGVSDADMAMWGGDSYYCEAEAADAEYDTFSIGYSRAGGHPVKRMSAGKVPVVSAADYYGKFLAVVFSPSDIQLMDGAADSRRRYFDSVISKFNNKYLTALRDYKKILALRNSLLKESGIRGGIDAGQMAVWTQMLAEKSLDIVLTRISFTVEFNEIFMRNYSLILDDVDPPALSYTNKMDACTLEGFTAGFNKNLKRDLMLGYTSSGPHRDDYWMKNKTGIDFSAYGSRGQKRSASIALKIAETEILEKLTSNSPVLLVDDVFSELDSGRRNNLSKLFAGGRQIIITMPEFEELSFFEQSSGKRFLVSGEGVVNEV